MIKQKHYNAILIENDFPRHPLVLDVMVQIHLPSGNILHCRREEDLRKYIDSPKNMELWAEWLANNLTHELLRGMHENVACEIRNTIMEKLKGLEL